MYHVQMPDIRRDRQPTLIVGHNEGRSRQWSGHRGFSRAVSEEVKQSGPREGGRGQVVSRQGLASIDY